MIFPCLVEADAVDLLENVDPVGWNSDLEAPFGASKVLWGEAFEGRAISAKHPKHLVTVRDIGAYEKSQIFGCSGLGVNAICKTTHKELLNSGVIECADQLLHVTGEHGGQIS